MNTTTTTQTVSNEQNKLVLNVPPIDVKARLAKDGEPSLFPNEIALR